MTESTLKVRASIGERWSKRCGFAVVAGLVIEVGLAIAYREHKTWIANWAPVIADILVALGVYGEIHFASIVKQAEDELRRISEENVAAASERAAVAELRTEKLRAQFSWRRLSAAKIAAISGELAKRPKASLSIRCLFSDPEAHTFAHDIGAVFTECGWKVGFLSASYSGELLFGIRVPNLKPPHAPFAAVVQAALTKADLEYLPQIPSGGLTVTESSGAGNSVPCAEMYIGPKPIPNLE